MERWRDLIGPEIVLAFVEAFLVAAIPTLGLGSAITNGHTAIVHQWPPAPAWGAAGLLGCLNGLRAIKLLIAPSPIRSSDAA